MFQWVCPNTTQIEVLNQLTGVSDGLNNLFAEVLTCEIAQSNDMDYDIYSYADKDGKRQNCKFYKNTMTQAPYFFASSKLITTYFDVENYEKKKILNHKIQYAQKQEFNET